MQAPELCCQILEQPHCLIAGSTGSGKSVMLNSLISTALLYGNKHLVLIDPKKVELRNYTASPVCIGYADTTENAVTMLDAVIALMNNRYTEMQRKGQKLTDREDIYLCIDELADLMISERKRDVLLKLQKLLQLGRAAKVHVIACTQVPNRKIIPAELTLNFTAKLGLHTDSAIESRQVIGIKGCEDLPMYGYGYYKSPGKIENWHIPFTADAEIYRSIRYNCDLNSHNKRCSIKTLLKRSSN